MLAAFDLMVNEIITKEYYECDKDLPYPVYYLH